MAGKHPARTFILWHTNSTPGGFQLPNIDGEPLKVRKFPQYLRLLQTARRRMGVPESTKTKICTLGTRTQPTAVKCFCIWNYSQSECIIGITIRDTDCWALYRLEQHKCTYGEPFCYNGDGHMVPSEGLEHLNLKDLSGCPVLSILVGFANLSCTEVQRFLVAVFFMDRPSPALVNSCLASGVSLGRLQLQLLNSRRPVDILSSFTLRLRSAIVTLALCLLRKFSNAPPEIVRMLLMCALSTYFTEGRSSVTLLSAEIGEALQVMKARQLAIKRYQGLERDMKNVSRKRKRQTEDLDLGRPLIDCMGRDIAESTAKLGELQARYNEVPEQNVETAYGKIKRIKSESLLLSNVECRKPPKLNFPEDIHAYVKERLEKYSV